MKDDIYYDVPEIIRFKNIIARVYTPILTEEERERRIKEAKKASVRLVLSKEKEKREKPKQY